MRSRSTRAEGTAWTGHWGPQWGGGSLGDQAPDLRAGSEPSPGRQGPTELSWRTASWCRRRLGAGGPAAGVADMRQSIVVDKNRGIFLYMATTQICTNRRTDENCGRAIHTLEHYLRIQKQFNYLYTYNMSNVRTIMLSKEAGHHGGHTEPFHWQERHLYQKAGECLPGAQRGKRRQRQELSGLLEARASSRRAYSASCHQTHLAITQTGACPSMEMISEFN